MAGRDIIGALVEDRLDNVGDFVDGKVSHFHDLLEELFPSAFTGSSPFGKLPPAPPACTKALRKGLKWGTATSAYQVIACVAQLHQ
jgi:hypothetical protein